MMSGYTKLFGSIVASTIWSEDDQTRIVWITMLAMKNQHGEVEASIPGLAKFAHVSLEATEGALAKLMAPDPYSRTKEFEGRRIEEIDGGWLVLNHTKYKNKASEDDEREKTRLRVQRFRQRNGEISVTPPVTLGNDAVTLGNDGNDIQIQIQTQIKETKPPSLKRQLTDGWVKAYLDAFKEPYLFQGAKDGQAADRLLSLGLTPEEIFSIAKKAWQQKNIKTHWYCVNYGRELAKFAAGFNSIRQELKNETQQNSSRNAGTLNEGKSSQYRGIGQLGYKKPN